MALPIWLQQFFTGKPRVAPPNAGNTDTPPGDPLVQTGGYQFIEPEMYLARATSITDIPQVPTSWQDWGQYGVNVMDSSGLTGGGVSSGVDANIVAEDMLYFDTSTGIYYYLGN